MSLTIKDLSQTIRYEGNIIAVLKDLYFYLEELEEKEEDDVVQFYVDPSRSNLEEHVNKLDLKDLKQLIKLVEEELIDMICNMDSSIKVRLYRALLVEPIIAAL